MSSNKFKINNLFFKANKQFYKAIAFYCVFKYNHY